MFLFSFRCSDFRGCGRRALLGRSPLDSLGFLLGSMMVRKGNLHRF
jgi:hypothetical protein